MTGIYPNCEILMNSRVAEDETPAVRTTGPAPGLEATIRRRHLYCTTVDSKRDTSAYERSVRLSITRTGGSWRRHQL
jgi:hypothetical protein